MYLLWYAYLATVTAFAIAGYPLAIHLVCAVVMVEALLGITIAYRGYRASKDL